MVGTEDPRPFDWCGVIVGHWLVQRPDGMNKLRRPLYRAVSRCGVASKFTRGELNAGASLTCVACHHRGGKAAPGGHAVDVHEDGLDEHLNRWEDGNVIDERSNLKGKEATYDWENHGREWLQSVVEHTGLGLDFGWKATVRDCHERAKPRGEAVVRARGYHSNQRRIELSIRPGGGRYSFEVDLATGRSDVPWVDVERAVQRALDRLASSLTVQRAGKQLAARTAAQAATAPAPVPTPALIAGPALPAPRPEQVTAAFAGLDLDRLLLLRSGMDRLHEAGTELRSIADHKRELTAKLQEAADREAPLQTAFVNARLGVTAARDEAGRVAEELERTRLRLAGLEATDADARARCAAAIAVLAAAAEVHKPAEEELQLARLALEECEAAERDRARQLARADDLGPLLVALQRLVAVAPPAPAAPAPGAAR